MNRNMRRAGFDQGTRIQLAEEDLDSLEKVVRDMHAEAKEEMARLRGILNRILWAIMGTAFTIVGAVIIQRIP